MNIEKLREAFIDVDVRLTGEAWTEFGIDCRINTAFGGNPVATIYDVHETGVVKIMDNNGRSWNACLPEVPLTNHRWSELDKERWRVEIEEEWA